METSNVHKFIVDHGKGYVYDTNQALFEIACDTNNEYLFMNVIDKLEYKKCSDYMIENGIPLFFQRLVNREVVNEMDLSIKEKLRKIAKSSSDMFVDIWTKNRSHMQSFDPIDVLKNIEDIISKEGDKRVILYLYKNFNVYQVLSAIFELELVDIDQPILTLIDIVASQEDHEYRDSGFKILSDEIIDKFLDDGSLSVLTSLFEYSPNLISYRCDEIIKHLLEEKDDKTISMLIKSRSFYLSNLSSSTKDKLILLLAYK